VVAGARAPVGSGPGFRRPVVVAQGEPLNRSGIGTVVVVPLTSNLLLESRSTGLARDSIASASQIVALALDLLTQHAGHLATHLLDRVLEGIDIVLDR
jgi:mRNA interferase MazF